jgi:hypothetical protein
MSRFSIHTPSSSEIRAEQEEDRHDALLRAAWREQSDPDASEVEFEEWKDALTMDDLDTILGPSGL